ncbi:Cathepsin D [Halotydeus destructor]|nr:Cathepsin D [Halotydeus destructor]
MSNLIAIFVAAAVISQPLSIQSSKIIRLPLANVADAYYTANITIGSPNQSFQVLLDTASTETWIPSVQCTSVYCGNHKKYDSATSTTYIKDGRPWSRAYTAGNVSGFLSSDVYGLDDASVAQTFGEVTQFGAISYALLNFDGIIGLGISKSSFSENNFIENLKEQSVIGQKIFGIYLKRNGTSQDGGQITIGALDESHYVGELEYHSLANNQSWSVNLEKLDVTGTEYVRNHQLLVNTGSAVNILPIDVARKLNTQIGAVPIAPGQYIVDCAKLSSLPDIDFVFHGSVLTFKPQEYTFRASGLCVSGFYGFAFPPQLQNTILAGNIFLQKYYAAFDAENSRIGFALRAQ